MQLQKSHMKKQHYYQLASNDLNFSSKIFLFKKELFLGFIHSEYGKHIEPLIDPLLTPGLGSLTLPLKRSLFLASKSLNSIFFNIFLNLQFGFNHMGIFFSKIF